jgi:hypothetical protein
MTRETLKRETCSARPITTRASRQQESATERLFDYALSAVGGYAKIDMSRGNVDDAGERGDGADSHRATLHAATGDVFKIVGRRSVSEQCGLNRRDHHSMHAKRAGTNRKGRRDGLTSW